MLIAAAFTLVMAIICALSPCAPTAWAAGDSTLALQAAQVSAQDAGMPMHRLYNPNSGEHFYTASATERDGLVKVGWRHEGTGWTAPTKGSQVYRLYNPNAGDHHYTLSAAERDWLAGLGWRYEGVGWLSGGTQKVLRQYNPNAVAGAHNFTTSQAENDGLVKVGWRAEGIGWYALADTTVPQPATPAVDPAPKTTARIHLTAGGSEAQVDSASVSGTTYLFLPAYANLSAVRITAVENGAEVPIQLSSTQTGTFTPVAVGDVANIAAISTQTGTNGAKMLWFRTQANTTPQRLAIMASQSLSTVNLASVNAAQGRAYVEASPDHSAKAEVAVTVVGPDGAVVYSDADAGSTSTVKGRGNSSWGNGNKKPYQVKLGKKADLLATGDSTNKAKKWLLLANAADPSLMRNLFAYNLGIELGMTGTECAPVDLYYDGEYRGNYLLCEKIEVGAGRVDIEDLEEAFEDANAGTDLSTLPRKQATNSYGMKYYYMEGAADPTDITGGYVLELDVGYYASEPCWFESSFGQVVVKSPEYCSQAAMTYISEQFEGAIRNLRAANANAANGRLFNIDSLAKTYLVSEATKEIDTFYSSTYFYKDSDERGDGRIYAAPLWDYDTIGMRHEEVEFYLYHGYLRPQANIKAASNPLVQEAAKRIWTEELSPLLHEVALGGVDVVGAQAHLRSFAYYRQLIAASQRMNETRFGITSFDFQIAPFATYDLNYGYLVNWIGWRTAWLDDNLPSMSGEVTRASTVYKREGESEGTDYGLVFDASYYRQAVGKPGLSDADALKDFVENGMAKGVVASRNFNVSVYKNRYQDLRDAYGDEWELYYRHYLEYGFFEGRLAV